MRATELIQKAKTVGLSVRPTAKGIVIRKGGIAFVVNPDDTAVRMGAVNAGHVTISSADVALGIE